MWVCQVCKNTNNDNLICEKCGFDNTLDYERYETFFDVANWKPSDNGRDILPRLEPLAWELEWKNLLDRAIEGTEEDRQALYLFYKELLYSGNIRESMRHWDTPVKTKEEGKADKEEEISQTVREKKNFIQEKKIRLKIAAKNARPVLYVKCLSIEHSTEEKRVEKDKFVIGRKKNCDIAFPDLRIVSNEHCAFVWRNEKWNIDDLDSKNGTYVNGIRLMKGASQRLRDGDIVKVASEKLQVFLRED